jgi:hypothetical protein
VEHAPADGFVGQVPKPSFDQIESVIHNWSS